MSSAAQADGGAEDAVELVSAIYPWIPQVRFVYDRHVNKWMYAARTGSIVVLRFVRVMNSEERPAMNWDISIGRLKQITGRFLQASGQRRFVLRGEAMQYAGRLQMRYGMLKHQAQWGSTMTHHVLQPIGSLNERDERATATRRQRPSA